MTAEGPADRLREALSTADASVRLQSALAAGTRPRDAYVPVLVERCAVESDFSVREMLTWALMRHPADLVVPPLLVAAAADGAQTRSQALHTLSKVRDPRGWAAITPEVLADPDDRVARTAWRAAAVLVPEGGRAGLAVTLVTQLARGDRDVRRSLSRALAELGEAALPALEAAGGDAATEVRIHAIATERIIGDPDEGFDAAMFEAERIVAGLGG